MPRYHCSIGLLGGAEPHPGCGRRRAGIHHASPTCRSHSSRTGRRCHSRLVPFTGSAGWRYAAMKFPRVAPAPDGGILKLSAAASGTHRSWRWPGTTSTVNTGSTTSAGLRFEWTAAEINRILRPARTARTWTHQVPVQNHPARVWLPLNRYRQRSGGRDINFSARFGGLRVRSTFARFTTIFRRAAQRPGLRVVHATLLSRQGG